MTPTSLSLLFLLWRQILKKKILKLINSFLTCVSLTDIDFKGIALNNNIGIDFDRKRIILKIMMILVLDCECKRAPGEN